MDLLVPFFGLQLWKNRFVQVLIITEAWKQKQAGRFLTSLPPG